MSTIAQADVAPVSANAAVTAPQKGDLKKLAETSAMRHGIPAPLFFALVTQESRWHPDAMSPKGAIGLAQLMPETAANLGVNPRDPRQNLDGGARYLREQYLRFGSWDMALAAYNAGPEAVLKYDGIPPYPETINYVRTVLTNAISPLSGVSAEEPVGLASDNPTPKNIDPPLDVFVATNEAPGSADDDSSWLVFSD